MTKRSVISLIFLYVGYMFLFIDRSVMNISLAFIGPSLHISTAQLGTVVSAFFLSYALMQIPGGYLVDKVGSKMMVVLSILLFSIFTIFTGLTWSFLSLIIVRFIFGIVEGPYPAAALKQISQLFSKKDKSQATSVTLSSNYAGAIVAPLIIGPLLGIVNWRWCFVILGAAGIVLLIGMIWYNRRNNQQDATDETTKTKINFKEIDKSVWQLFIVGLGLNIMTKGLDTWMPTYLLKNRGINLLGISWMTPLPMLAAGIAAFISGFIMMKWFKGHEKLLISGATLLSFLGMVGLYLSQSLTLVIIFDVALFFFKAMAYTTMFAYLAQIIAEKNYGSTVGVVEFGGQLGGFIAPILIGYIVQISGGSFTMSFLVLAVSAGLAFIASLFIPNRKAKKA